MTKTTPAAGLLLAVIAAVPAVGLGADARLTPTGVLTPPPASQRPTDIVRWSAKPAQAEVKAGAVLPIAITADVQRDWFLYGLTQPKGGPIPLNFAGAKGKLFQVQPRDIKGPEPIVKDDPVFDLTTRMHEGRTVFTVPVLVSRGVAPGRQTIPIEITFQACGEGICLRPYTHTVTVDVTVR